MSNNTDIVAISYNVFSGSAELASRERRQHAIREITSKNPDIICLQEATTEFIKELLNSLNANFNDAVSIAIATGNNDFSFISDYKQFLSVEKTNVLGEEEIDIVEKTGFIAIITRLQIVNVKWIYKGGYYDDGIVRMDLHVGDEKKRMSVYNVHLSGGTFDKPPHVILQKRIRRIMELEFLNQDIRKNTERSVLVMGDFNSDANAPYLTQTPYNYDPNSINHENEYPETLFYPNKQHQNIVDAWTELRKDDPGFTEDSQTNMLRKHLKPGQNRRARFDQVYTSTDMQLRSIDMIGTNTIILHDDLEVHPSDHYGLCLNFSI